MAVPTMEELLDRNTDFARSSYTPRPYLSEMSSMGLPPSSTIIVTCADPRICPEQFLGLHPGEAIVFRTVGGRVRPILHDILTLDSFFGHGTISRCLVIHHTDCGASHFQNEAIKREIISRHPERSEEINGWDFGSFEQNTIAESVREDMGILLGEGMIGDKLKDGIQGLVFDIKTGRIHTV